MSDKRRMRVYLSGPISNGGMASPEERERNMRRTFELHATLTLAQFAVLNPMLTHLIDEHQTIPHEVWLAADLAWVEAADVVYRLPGESTGADQEVAYAKALDIPVVHDLDHLLLERLRYLGLVKGFANTFYRLPNAIDRLVESDGADDKRDQVHDDWLRSLDTMAAQQDVPPAATSDNAAIRAIDEMLAKQALQALDRYPVIWHACSPKTPTYEELKAAVERLKARGRLVCRIDTIGQDNDRTNL